MDSNRFTGNTNSDEQQGGGSNGNEAYLRNLNRNSVKITKPGRKAAAAAGGSSSSSSTFSYPTGTQVPLLGGPNPNPNPLYQGHDSSSSTVNPISQPPVFNISKNDFRAVVQKLTGAPPNDRLPPSQPPPAAATRPFSSRLQRIRPPPLAQIGNRPPPMMNSFPIPPRAPPQQQNNEFGSMLPPLPSVHHAAESPISAYMRVLQNSVSANARGPAPGPTRPEIRANNPQNDDELLDESPVAAYMRVLHKSPYAPRPPHRPPAPAPAQFQAPAPAPVQASAPAPVQDSAPDPAQAPAPTQFQAPAPGVQQQQQQSSPFTYMPNSPLPFGCSNNQQFGMLSPGMLSPGLLLSPNSQFGWSPQLPVSPTVSPGWKGI